MEDHYWQLIAKQIKGELSPTEQLEWTDWLSESESNLATYKQAKAIWSEQRAYSDLSDEQFLEHIGTDSDQVWNGILSQISEKPSVQKLDYRWLYKIAAVLLLAVGLGWTALQYSSDIGMTQTHIETADYTDSILLPDSTKVWLNKHSAISYGDFSGDTREVTLDGEAFFEVKRNEQKPFIVSTHHARIQVLGTSFNINSRNDIADESLTVASGKVAYSPLSTPESQIQLIQDESATLSEDKGLPIKTETDPNFLAWKSGILIFKNDTLEEVQQVLSKYYGVKISIADPNIRNKRLTAKFEQMNVDEAVQVLCNLYHLQSVQQGTTINLKKK